MNNKIKKMLNEMLESLNEENFIIVLEVSQTLFAKIRLEKILEEGKWEDSNVKDYWYRMDAPNPAQNQQRHIVIAHKKHIHNKNKQVSWNDTGKRHDKYSFDTNFRGIKKAKEIARKVLKLPDDIKLEQIESERKKILLEEVDENLPRIFIKIKQRGQNEKN